MDTDPMAELPAELKQNMTRYKAPPGLKRRIRHMLAQESRGPGLLEKVRASWTRWVPVGASFACGALVAIGVVTYREPGDDEQLDRQVVASHVRSLMADHLTDVASTDQHTVKPWFTGKLDYAPPVVDLAQQGFPLAGGRLDYLQDRPVAALVYRRRGHTINVFVLPAREARSPASTRAMRHGYQVAEWEGAGMRFWAVSDISGEEMALFTAAMKAAI
ncbi:MAG TPA: anti-sigma factor [Ramlibacter sp.]|nr:anti-sigma factor [Ramlibacter sp.]